MATGNFFGGQFFGGGFFGAIAEAVISGGGDSRKFKAKRKVFYLPNGTRVLATEEEFQALLNPTPETVMVTPQPHKVEAKEVVISIPSHPTDIPRLSKEIRQLEDAEDIAIAKWMLMH